MTEQNDLIPRRPKVSIISITYENLGGLQATVASVMSQLADKRDWELLIVDGGSKDGSLAYLEGISSVANWSSQRDRGVYHAMNIGLERSNGDFHMFLNAGDTFADTGSLNAVIQGLKTDPTWLVGGALHLNPGGKPFIVANRPHQWQRHALGLQPHCHQACVFSTSLALALGGYSETFGFAGDFDFILRIGLVSAPLELAEVIVRYEGGGRSAAGGLEIPQLLHRIRVERMQLGKLASIIDTLVVRQQQARQCAVKLKGTLLTKVPASRTALADQ